MRQAVPVRTFADWHAAAPGFVEADLVAHSGGDPSGSFLQTLVLTDVASGWTECVALVVQDALVVEALTRLGPLPMWRRSERSRLALPSPLYDPTRVDVCRFSWRSRWNRIADVVSKLTTRQVSTEAVAEETNIAHPHSLDAVRTRDVTLGRAGTGRHQLAIPDVRRGVH